nr:hypothetical protein [Tanacetum cinerariifolium]
MLWGIVIRSNANYAKLLWEEFVQAIQTFFSHWASLSIPLRSQLIMSFLTASNLKFVPKGEKDKVFRMLIPKELITEAIQQSPYYQQYLEMAAHKPTAKESPRGQVPVGGVAIHEPVSETTRQVPVVEDKGKGIATNEQAAQSLLDLHKPKKKNAEIGADLEKTNSGADTEILNVGEEQGEDVSNTVALEERTVELDEGQTGSDLAKTPESRPPPDHVILKVDQARSNPGQSHVALVGPNPEPMHEDFLALVYPKVHKSLKHTTEEQVLIENPPSSTGTLSSMKNLEDNFTFGDQFINNKPTEEDPGKTYMETEVESIVTVPIHQASSSVPPLSIHVIDLTPPKHVSFTV